jgi:DNA polymerase-1
MPTLYLIDGNSYIYRAFYAIKRLSNSEGFPTNAIYGFTNMILKVLREKRPDFFAVVFDSPVPTERHRAYEEYKAHRPKMPDDLAVQIQPIKDIIDAFKIPNIEIEGYEADDVLATIAKEAEKEKVDVYIITADKDINQILSQHIKTYDTMRDRITEDKDIVERYGVEPSRFPEVMALMGDTSDNIPGVPGVGEKTAISLLKEFGTLENLMKNHSRIKKPKLKAAVSENLDNIKLSLKLASINTHVPVNVPIKELIQKAPEWERLSDCFHKFEFKSLLKLIPEQFSPQLKKDDTEYIAVLDVNTLKSGIDSIKNECAFDTETTSKSPITAELVGISFSADLKRAYYIPVAHSYEGMPAQLKKSSVIKEFRDILENPEIRKIGHNIKYDLLVLKHEGVDLTGATFDTMLASYLLNPNKAKHNLEDVTMTYLGFKKLSYNDVTDRGKKNFRDVPVDIATRYSGEDSAVTFKLKKLLGAALKREGLEALFYDIEMPLIKVLADMESAGIKIDLPLMKNLSRQLGKELEALEKRIYFLAGEEFNINSPKQLQEILFEKLGLKPIKKTKTGLSTDVGVLEQLSLEHELPKEILEHRTLSKLKSTYVDSLPKLINPLTGRIHTSFNQTVTATGRLSSSEPNLQNIPVRGDWGQRIREAFIAENGHVLLSSDYSQIELRILAHLSQDSGLIDVFRADGDIHTRTACELFGVAPHQVTLDMRRGAKTVNFGIIYGISPYGLSRQLGISPEEAKQYIETYFAQHSMVKTYINSLIEKATETGFVSTIFNRKRAIPELHSTNKNTRQLGERLAMNTPIQGSAADIIKVAMINIHKRLQKEGFRARILLQVHDELLVEMPAKEKVGVQALVKEEMEHVLELRVPLTVDAGTGKNWAEAH